MTTVDDVLTSEFLVAWPDKNSSPANGVYSTFLAPNFTPLPV